MGSFIVILIAGFSLRVGTIDYSIRRAGNGSFQYENKNKEFSVGFLLKGDTPASAGESPSPEAPFVRFEVPRSSPVIPAIRQPAEGIQRESLDPRLRGDDKRGGGDDKEADGMTNGGAGMTNNIGIGMAMILGDGQLAQTKNATVQKPSPVIPAIRQPAEGIQALDPRVKPGMTI